MRERHNHESAMIAIAVLVLLVCAMVLAWGNYRAQAQLQAWRRALDAASRPVTPPTVDFRELDGLPAPVQRYLRLALTEGMPLVAKVDMRHSGAMNMGELKAQWKPFTSDQHVLTKRPGFGWNARISMLPGVKVRVSDNYVAGTGSLHAGLFGLITLADMGGSDDMNRGELLRFFAESPWYPTALLPSQGVTWQAVDAHAARATMSDGALSVSLLIGFNQAGLIGTVYAEARGRTVKGRLVQTPWQGRFWHYQHCAGMQLPYSAEVAWMLTDGAAPYWRADLVSIAHTFTGQ
jgi:hypothetical protein